MLHHVEKIILVVAITLMGLFLWLGYSTPVFNEKTPKQMVQMAGQAKSYIENGESWTKIAEHRKGDANAHVRIEQASKVVIGTDQYKRGRLLGTKAKALGMRKDPVLRAPIEIVAVPLYVPLLINNQDQRQLAINTLPLASAGGADEEDDESGGLGRGGRGGGPPGPPGGGGGDDEEKKKKRSDELEFGETMPEIQAQYMPGLRPKKANLSSSKHRAEVTKVMAIFGLVEIKNQWAEYDKVLQDSTAFYPARDKPVYQYVEVQRREKGQGDDAWIDVTKKSRSIARKLFPSTISQYGAPEVIDADYYDTVLTGKIPPISMVDYRKMANHPNGKVTMRTFPGSSIDDEEEKKEVSEGSSLEEFQVSEEEEDSLDTEDMNEGGPGEGRGGRGDFEGGPEGEDDDRGDESAGSERDSKEKRRGSDRSDYIAIMKAKAAKGDYKLLRFFDIGVPEGKEFEYRVRVWLADPNNENPDGFAQALADENNGERDTPSMGMAGLGEDDSSPGGDEDDEAENYEYVKLESTMKDPSVRARIAKQLKQKEADPKSLPLAALEYARPTEWASTSNAVNSGKDLGSFYAGKVTAGRQKRINNSFYIPMEDSSADVVTTVWSKLYHTQIPGRRTVKSGDVLNFKPETAVHVLHPVDWSVRKLEKPPELKTDAVVIDILGGEDLRITQSKMNFSLPGEILIMDAEGNFRVQNDIKDRLNFRHALFLDDELAEVGKKKKKKEDEFNEGGDDFPGQ